MPDAALVLVGQLVAVTLLAGVAAVQVARRVPGGWRVPAWGGVAFVASQVVRIPLLIAVGVAVPSLSVPFAIVSSGVFEETGRLVVLRTLARRVRGWRDGVGFGVGHGVAEAVLVTALAVLSTVTLLVVGDAVIADAPPEVATQVTQQIEAARAVRPVDSLAAIIERVAAVCVHVGLSITVLRGVRTGGAAMWGWWAAAVAAHAAFNGVALLGLAAGGVWLAEGLVATAAVVAVAWTRAQRGRMPEVAGEADG